MAQGCNPRNLETEAEKIQAQGEPESLSQNTSLRETNLMALIPTTTDNLKKITNLLCYIPVVCFIVFFLFLR